MAFSVTARHSGNGGETAAETLGTSSATPTADSLFLVCSAAQNDNHQIAPTFEDPSGGGLSYTQVDTIGEVPWDGSASFALSAAVERADVGGSPSAFTVTVDHWLNSQTAYYGAVCLDITGHDATTPIVQSKTAGTTKGGGNSESGSVTLDSALTSGNLVVVSFAAGADGGGGFATPTLGGQAMSAVTNQDASFTQVGVFSRVVDGTESDATITCSDLGDVVGNFTAIAVEIPAEAGGGTTFEQSVAGSITPAATLVQQTRKTLAGSTTPSGVLASLIGKLLDGTITPGGALQQQSRKTLAGAIEPGGSLTRRAAKALAGNAGPTGALTRQPQTTLSGAVTPTGTVATTLVKLIELAGSIAPVGALVRQARKALGGGAAPGGTVNKSVAKTLSGTISPTGALLKLASKLLGGGVTPSGTVATQVSAPTDDPNPFSLTHREPGGVVHREPAGIVHTEQATVVYRESAALTHQEAS